MTGQDYTIVTGTFSLGPSLGVKTLHILEFMNSDKATGTEVRTIKVTCTRLWNMHQQTSARGFEDLIKTSQTLWSLRSISAYRYPTRSRENMSSFTAEDACPSCETRTEADNQNADAARSVPQSEGAQQKTEPKTKREKKTHRPKSGSQENGQKENKQQGQGAPDKEKEPEPDEDPEQEQETHEVVSGPKNGWVITQTVEKDPKTINHHLPFKYLKRDSKVAKGRMRSIDGIKRSWSGVPPTSWFPKQHRPLLMPEDPKDWCQAFLGAFEKLSKVTVDDISLAHRHLTSVATKDRQRPDARLCSEDILSAAVDREKEKDKQSSAVGEISRLWAGHEPPIWLPKSLRPADLQEDPLKWDVDFLNAVKQLAAVTSRNLELAKGYLEDAVTSSPSGKLDVKVVRNARRMRELDIARGDRQHEAETQQEAQRAARRAANRSDSGVEPRMNHTHSGPYGRDSGSSGRGERSNMGGKRKRYGF